MAEEQRFPAVRRLRGPAVFQALFRRGLRSNGPFFLMIAGVSAEPQSRLGLTVGRRVGSAVRRNRAKRLLRECFRRNLPTIAIDVILVAKREIVDAQHAELEQQYRRRLRELGRRLVAGARSKGADGRD